MAAFISLPHAITYWKKETKKTQQSPERFWGDALLAR